MPLRFTIFAIPRTKKTSSRLVGLGKKCFACGKRAHVKILPSEAFEVFEQTAVLQGMVLTGKIHALGQHLPIEGPVHVKALFYRDANRGDLTGYEQALADVLQAPTNRRKGIGIIRDDVQIKSWDGTRLLVDRENPRIEIEINRMDGEQGELYE